MGLLDRVAGLFYEPGAVFRSLVRKPDYMLPIVLIVLGAGISCLATLRGDLTAALSPAQAEAIAKIPRARLAALATASYALTISLGWFVRSLAFAALGKAVGGEGKFSRVLSAQGYVMIPQFLGGLLSTVLLLGLGRPVALGLNDLLPLARWRTPLGIVLGQANPFVLGYLILASIAIAETLAISRRKAGAIVVGCWIPIVLVSLAMAALSPAG